MGRTRSNTTVYDVLDQSGFLTGGTQQQLDEAREAYWKEYRKLYARRKRQEEKAFTISFTQKEYKQIQKASHGFHSCTDFIKKSVLNASQSTHSQLSPNQFASLIEILSLTYSALQSLEDDEKITASQIEKLYQSLECQEKIIKQNFNSLNKS